MEDERLCAAVITAGSGAAGDPSVAVVSDRRLSVAALVALLQNGPLDNVLCVVNGPRDVKAALDECRPEVIIADGTWSRWPGMNNLSWGGRVLLLLDPEDDPRAFKQAVQSGADGYLSRSASAPALAGAIEAMRKDRRYLDPLLEGHIHWAAEEVRLRLPLEPRLSQRELEIIAAIAKGRSTKEIARDCSVTAKTVCNHISHIYGKLNIKDRGQLVMYAVQEGLL
jgi:DNA-binding NarL/FixJ family response regulator